MVLAVALQAVTDGLKALTTQLRVGVEAGNNVDLALRGLGTSLEQEAGPLTESMGELRGSLSDRLVPALLSMQAGMQGNTLGVQQLINQQKLTGTQYAGTAKAFAALEAIGGLQRESTERLSLDIVELGGQFGVTTDVLVKALEGLGDNLIDIDLMGLPDHVTEALTQLQAMAGPQLASSFDKAVDLLLSPKIEAISQRALLGLPEPTEVLRRTRTTEEAIETIIEGFQVAGLNFREMAEGGMGAIAAAEAVFGPTGKLFVPLAEAFGERAREETKAVQEFGDAFNVIKNEVFVPLQAMFMQKLTPVLQRFAERFAELNEQLMPKFAHFLENAINVLIGWVSQLPSVMANVLDGLHSAWISISMMDFGGICNDMKDIFAFGGSVFNDFILDIKLIAAEIRIQAHKIANPLESMGDAFFGGTMDPNGPLAKLIQARDEAANVANPFGPTKTEFLQGQSNEAITRLGQRFEMFQVNWEKGDMGTKFFGPIIEPWTEVLQGVEKNTKDTATAILDSKDTSPDALEFIEGEKGRAMRDILGIPQEDALRNVMEEQRDILIRMEENQVKPMPGHDPFASELGPAVPEF